MTLYCLDGFCVENGLQRAVGVGVGRPVVKAVIVTWLRGESGRAPVQQWSSGML